MTNNDISQKLKTFARDFEKQLEKFLSPHPRDFEICRPASLVSAMHYACMNGGKRLRPFLIYKSCELFNGDLEAALDVGCAIEFIHCYSLAHDDLPAMDDDDLRRGNPSLHKKFSESTAILAGDALLTLAFDIIASNSKINSSIALRLISLLSQLSGMGGMVGGQILDLAAENQNLSEQEIITSQLMKTGCLLNFCTMSGAIIAGADESDIKIMQNYGTAIGLAFQLADDILDITSTPEILGKSCGKDIKQGKATIASLYGLEKATQQLNGLIIEAVNLLKPYGERAKDLINLSFFIKDRNL